MLGIKLLPHRNPAAHGHLQSGQGGVIKLGPDANLTITGGSLAYLVGLNGVCDRTIDFSSRTGLNQLTEGRLLKATGPSGEVLASTPEPNSEILLASGLGALLIRFGFEAPVAKRQLSASGRRVAPPPQ